MNRIALTPSISPTVRIARPTLSLTDCERFYIDGLGLEKLGSFKGHDGFDGLMVGMPSANWHLEFTTSQNHVAPQAPSEENLIVLYIPETDQYDRRVSQMIEYGYSPAPSLNPYWDKNGTTFVDPDGYRVVLSNQNWPLK